jgi:hypothetical protein
MATDLNLDASRFDLNQISWALRERDTRARWI